MCRQKVGSKLDGATECHGWLCRSHMSGAYPEQVENSVDAHACISRFDRIEQNGNKRVNRARRKNPILLPGLITAKVRGRRSQGDTIQIVDDLRL